MTNVPIVNHEEASVRDFHPLFRALYTMLLLAPFGLSASAAEVRFSRDILPILSDNCFQCHGPDAKARKGKLRLDTEAGAHRKTDPVIVAGKGAESELIARVTSHDNDEMMPPPKSARTLTPRQIDLLKRWIDEGAKWGRHWAFEPVTQPPIPAVRNETWPRNPIDRFVLARLEEVGLSPSAEAEKTALIRRVSLDLTGLPPTPEAVDAFLTDRSPGAYENLVDRLLASPQYGERMVWEWLDAARYADSNGYQGDGERTMWPWRDWAIDALNRNMPFDRFTTEQLAGDLLPGASIPQKLATGFCRNHMINGEGGRIPEENRVDYVMDMAETTGTIWLGLTFNCCRCHDHKFDPITQRDYYSLFAFFNQTPVNGGDGSPQSPPAITAPSADQARMLEASTGRLSSAVKEVEDLEQRVLPRPVGRPASESPKATVLKPEILALLKVPAGQRDRGQLAQLEKHWAAAEPAYATLLKKQREVIEARDGLVGSFARVMVMEDMSKPRETFILTRGSYEKPATKVDAAVPGTMPPLPANAPRNRLGLARWITANENPLTARVTVNRAWQQFFGIGLVKTTEDFGVQGELPSHPELLDWLASEFIRSGWDVKALHRLIVTSATYRQSSRVSPALIERDPLNRLLARGARFRLPAWMIRDQALAASGLLVDKVGGPPVKPYQPSGVWEEATFGTKKYVQDHGEALYRRSVYTFWRRIVGPTEFFDSAPRQTCVVKPTRTNTPLHALTTLNDPTFVEAARALAERVLKSNDAQPAARVERMFRVVLGRKPSAEETQVLVASLNRVQREFAGQREAAKQFLSVGESQRAQAIDPIEHAAYTALASAIFNLDEALVRE